MEALSIITIRRHGTLEVTKAYEDPAYAETEYERLCEAYETHRAHTGTEIDIAHNVYVDVTKYQGDE